MAEAWGEWIASMGEWHVFGGLTYDPRAVDRRPGVQAVRGDLFRWLGDTKEHPGVFVEAAVIAIEYQRNEWPHGHPLLRLRGGLAPDALGVLGQAWFQRHGWAQLERPRSTNAVAAYAAKYLAKDLGKGDVIFWPRRGQLGVHEPSMEAFRSMAPRPGR